MAAKIRDEEFVQLITESQRSLHAFIFSLVCSSAEADDALQETNLVLWKKRDEFQRGTEFRAWAMKVAYLQVLAMRKKQRRNPLQFSDELLAQLAEQGQSRGDHLESLRNALTQCAQKLSQADQQLLRLRYGGSLSAAEISRQVGRSSDAIYQCMCRIRKSLTQCVQRTLAREEHV